MPAPGSELLYSVVGHNLPLPGATAVHDQVTEARGRILSVEKIQIVKVYMDDVSSTSIIIQLFSGTQFLTVVLLGRTNLDHESLSHVDN